MCNDITFLKRRIPFLILYKMQYFVVNEGDQRSNI